MAFDAGMLAAAAHEIRSTVLGARVEKINQPSRDEIVILIRSYDGGRRIDIQTGANPRICFTGNNPENPPVPPMFCMLLRKHLSGAKLTDVRQEGFERVVTLEFEARDEMGFLCVRRLVAEIMGKYSNLIFTDGDGKILGAVKLVDFSTSGLRQILPGMKYELPPKQDKADPMTADKETFLSLLSAYSPEKGADRFLTDRFFGISAAVAREICFRAAGHTDEPVAMTDGERLWREFSSVTEMIRTGAFLPTAVYDEGGKPVEYAFLPLTQYGEGFVTKTYSGAGELLDTYFAERDRETNLHQKASDLLRLLTNAEARVRKKLELQRAELADCEKGSGYKRAGDLITANLWQLKRGMKQAELTDYEDLRPDGSFGTVTVTLDERLSPAENAQKYFRKYTKSKNARVVLTGQVARDEEELTYLYSVFDSLSRAETSNDLMEIRGELFRSGYASKMKNYSAPKKSTVPTVMKFRTGGGLSVLCGKNNVQNEYVTHKLAEKTDYWFHAKGVPGSHVVLVTGGTEPDAADFTDAAEIAAFYSQAEGQNIAVDYTLAKNVKKPAGGKPGFVIYHTNWTAYVTPDKEKIAAMRQK